MDIDKTLMTPISKDLLYVKVADAINNYIINNDLQPGDRLPSERKMAEMFNVSRNSVREALRVLEKQNAGVQIKSGSGVYLTEHQPGGAFYLELVRKNFSELHELAYALERISIHKAIEYGTDKQKEEALSIAKSMLDLSSVNIYNSDIDLSFHLKISDMAQNNTITSIIKQLRENVFNDYWKILKVDESAWLDTVPFHYDLAEAILNKDEELALSVLDKISTHSYDVKINAQLKLDSQSLK